jgi:hypothetical protein
MYRVSVYVGVFLRFLEEYRDYNSDQGSMARTQMLGALYVRYAVDQEAYLPVERTKHTHSELVCVMCPVAGTQVAGTVSEADMQFEPQQLGALSKAMDDVRIGFEYEAHCAHNNTRHSCTITLCHRWSKHECDGLRVA